jgi:hypothetical protein
MDSKKRILKVVCAENISWWHKIGVWAIKEAEGVDFNHFAYLSDDGYIYEAVLPKSRSKMFSEWLKIFKVVRTYEFELEEKLYHKIMRDIYDELDKPYSIFQIISIWISQSLKIASNKFKYFNINGEKALICSELVARPLANNMKIEFGINLDNVGMDELELVLKNTSTRSY